jgi:dihydroorotate dehydrogenase (fumarate)
MNINAKFMGLNIKSPIIVGSCGLTAEIETLKQMDNAGAGAVVLKSVFEEQILQQANNNLRNADYYGFPEAYDYIKENSQSHAIEKYLNLLRQAKQNLSIPVIASINCISNSEWLNFATKLEAEGADGIELNMFVLPSDTDLTTEDVERFYEDTIHIIKRAVAIPISIKISTYFTSLARFVQKLSWLGISNLNIFNRFCLTDIDIETLTTKPAHIKTSQDEIYDTIRWCAILSSVKNHKCSLTAGGGVHHEEDVIKLLLAGADTIQTVSAIYLQGVDFIQKSNERLATWMQEKNYSALSDFKGMLAIDKEQQASSFHRVQFMKYFADIK